MLYKLDLYMNIKYFNKLPYFYLTIFLKFDLFMSEDKEALTRLYYQNKRTKFHTNISTFAHEHSNNFSFYKQVIQILFTQHSNINKNIFYC